MVTQSSYKDIPALKMETEKVSALVIPSQGGKIASLICKATGRELLFQNPGPTYKPHVYDGVFTDSECSGYDDMFPTIDPCVCEHAPWTGVPMPDHGEVCALPMRCDLCGDRVMLRAEGVRFPYAFEKTMYFADAGTLRIDYRLTNCSANPLDCLWAAHPILDAGEGGEILLPFPEGERAVCTFVDGVEPPKADLIWPQGRSNKALGNLSQVDAHLRGKAYKIYFQRPTPMGACGFRWMEDGTELWLHYPPEQVPWLGVLAGEHMPTRRLQVFLEPCLGAFDSPPMARKKQQFFVLPACGLAKWYLEFCVSND